MKDTWEFEYTPLSVYQSTVVPSSTDFVVATTALVAPSSLALALEFLTGAVVASTILSVHPLYWSFLRSSNELRTSDVEAALRKHGISVRYVADARTGSQRLGPAADYSTASAPAAHAWKVRDRRPCHDIDSPGRWFLRDCGVNVDRRVCGTGARSRLAVLDNECAGIEHIELDSEVSIGVETIPRSSLHAALMIGWAVGAIPGRFAGVAPDATVRLYCIPKPGDEVYRLPEAIVRAVNDGADVVLCSTYVDGQTSPMLDDALDFARRMGRAGKGAAIVMPSSREMSSPPGSSHASLSLGMGEPASDPRVFCIGPSSRAEGWFLWRDKRGKLHPFANRGPSLRWLAPGDDMAFPLSPTERLAHAESSGAAAVAAGVLLLLVSVSPELTSDDLDALLTLTAAPVAGASRDELRDLADPRDLLPLGIDADGHNAKHGYGRVNAALACAAACDPMAASFIAIGEPDVGLAMASAVAEQRESAVLGPAAARWLSRQVLGNTSLRHSLTSIARAARLWVARPASFAQQPTGSLLRQALLAIRSAVRDRASPDPVVTDDLARFERFLVTALNDPQAAAKLEHEAMAWLGWLVSESPGAATRAIGSQSVPEASPARRN